MTPDEAKTKIRRLLDSTDTYAGTYAVLKAIEILESIDAPSIDHRDLLRKYMDHVGGCEGRDFIDDVYRYDGDGDLLDYVELTEDEWAELVRISEGVDHE